MGKEPQDTPKFPHPAVSIYFCLAASWVAVASVSKLLTDSNQFFFLLHIIISSFFDRLITVIVSIVDVWLYAAM
jgi:hypothetical protein